MDKHNHVLQRFFKSIFIFLPLTITLMFFNNCMEGFQSANVADFGSSGDNTGGQNPLVSQCVSSASLEKMQLHRLTNEEYINTIKDLFNVVVLPSAFPSSDQAGGTGFTNEYTLMNRSSSLTSNVSSAYLTLAIDNASKIMSQNANAVLGLACNSMNDSCYNSFIRTLGLKVFRRPVTEGSSSSELQLLKLLFSKVSSFSEGAELVLASMLSSPNFLYKSYGAYTSTQSSSVNLDRYELATRLSYFLWASAPDDQLLNSDLTIAVNLDAELKRMLVDPKAKRITTVFADQWFKYSRVENSSVPAEFGVSSTLLASAKNESVEFINYVLTKSNRLLDLWDADYTFLNSSLASHYGLSGVSGSNLTLINNVGAQRGGLISQASFLINTSGGSADTHPVSRGAWVLNNVLCDTVPPAPPGVTIPDAAQVAQTPKEMSQIHSLGVSCRACHARMDPLGLGLENYDASGKWQTIYQYGKWGNRNISVDPSGLIDGQPFDTPSQLKRIIASHPETGLCMSQKIVSYALGRSLNSKDYCLSEDLGQNVILKNGSFEDVVKKIVTNPSFNKNGR